MRFSLPVPAHACIMAGYWREYVDWGRHDLLVPPRLICSPRPPGRRWAERVFMYLPGIVSDRSWRQGSIPLLYALPVWCAKQTANWAKSYKRRVGKEWV